MPPTTTFYDVGSTPEGKSCFRAGSEPVPAGVDPQSAQAAAQAAFEDAWTRGKLPRCPEPDKAPAPPGGPKVPDHQALEQALRAELAQRLPAPVLRIAPGRAITGKDAFLEIDPGGGGEMSFPNPFGGPDAHVVARASYRVDWGDGTSTTTTSRGGPWPGGDLRHVWANVGRYDVVVTATWGATWSAQSDAGTIEGLVTVGRLDQFPVTQVQAVRER